MFGAIFAQNYLASANTIIHYDRAATQLGEEECDPPPDDTCTDCQDCNNQACTPDGTCGGCVTDADCCVPLRCNDGTCELND